MKNCTLHPKTQENIKNIVKGLRNLSMPNTAFKGLFVFLTFKEQTFLKEYAKEEFDLDLN